MRTVQHYSRGHVVNLGTTSTSELRRMRICEHRQMRRHTPPPLAQKTTSRNILKPSRGYPSPAWAPWCHSGAMAAAPGVRVPMVSYDDTPAAQLWRYCRKLDANPSWRPSNGGSWHPGCPAAAAAAAMSLPLSLPLLVRR